MDNLGRLLQINHRAKASAGGADFLSNFDRQSRCSRSAGDPNKGMSTVLQRGKDKFRPQVLSGQPRVQKAASSEVERSQQRHDYEDSCLNMTDVSRGPGELLQSLDLDRQRGSDATARPVHDFRGEGIPITVEVQSSHPRPALLERSRLDLREQRAKVYSAKPQFDVTFSGQMHTATDAENTKKSDRKAGSQQRSQESANQHPHAFTNAYAPFSNTEQYESINFHPQLTKAKAKARRNISQYIQHSGVDGCPSVVSDPRKDSRPNGASGEGDQHAQLFQRVAASKNE